MKFKYLFFLLIIFKTYGQVLRSPDSVTPKTKEGKNNKQYENAVYCIIAPGKMADVLAEKKLYEKKGSPYFYCKFIVRNKTGKLLAVDLQQERLLIHPNQWGVYVSKNHTNERQVEPDSLDEKKKNSLLEDFRNKKLTFIQPYSEFFYYKEFNNSGRKDIKIHKKGSFILSCDGQLFFCDGTECETVLAGFDNPLRRDLVLPYPIVWDKIAEEKIISVNDTLNYTLLAGGKMAQVFVEEKLYEKNGSLYFYCKFIIKNKSTNPLGVDLREYGKVPHPNQWGVHKENYRSVIDEESLIPDSLNQKKKDSLVKDFKNKNLLIIPPNSETSYFREFNASGRKDIKINEKEFFILSFDGQLFFCDGTECEALCVSFSNPQKTDLVLPYPIKWETIKSGEKVLEKK